MRKNVSKNNWPLKYSILMKAVCMGASLLTVGGCGLTGLTGPRARLGYIPTATPGVVFADPDNLGRHASVYSPFENSGLVYTCGAGHLDIDHIRGNADLTRHFISRIRKALTRGQERFSYKLSGETSRHVIEITYPADWDSRTDKEQIIEDVAFGTGPYLAFDATVWHEILTWFGVHFMGFEPEFNSAFSWEDLYSNLLGTRLAVDALNDAAHDYDEAMTLALDAVLKELGIQPRDTAIAAAKKVEGTWYTGNLVPDVTMRNFDIGMDGSITPTLIEGAAGCPDAKAVPLPAPTLERLKHYGFSITHEIRPNVFEQGAIFKAAGSKRIFPEIHYPILLEYMKQDAEQRGYQYTE
ncbi:MAG: DUF4056 domain-containing protein [Planctomycetales bacterium]|nr:DUF4056 domain-containing protein [Planctomycetales bacterium]